jgi:hypothetical protein
MNQRLDGLKLNGHGATILGLDPKQRRIKVIAVQPGLIVAFLQLNGTMAVRCEGWPEGAEVVSVGFMPDGHYLLTLYHPDFPFILDGVQPGMIEIKVHWEPVPTLEQAEDA